MAASSGKILRCAWMDPAHPLHWYCRAAPGMGERVHLIVPEDRTGSAGDASNMPGGVTTIQYSQDERLDYSAGTSSDTVWILNGKHLPLIDWPAAENTWRSCDASVLAYSGAAGAAAGRYRESVRVDHAGEVVSFRRHYDDSASYSNLWSDEASMVAVSGADSQFVINHLLEWGWGLESVGALTRRFNVRWAAENCIPTALGSAAPAATVEELLADAAAYRESPDLTEEECETLQCTLSAVRSDPGPNIAELPDLDDPYAEDNEEESKPAVAARLNPAAKRIFDFTASLGGLIVLFPLLAIIAILIKCTSRGPILFGHIRQGLNGREFPCWKFRSMRANAEELQAQLQAQNEVDGPQFKIRHDPRLTKIGNFLRNSNVDELPQLFNVLIGQMSLIGPRPSPDKENQLCPAWRRARLSIRPGITGLWQVLRGRRQASTDFQEWIYYDMEYVKHQSFWLDLNILLNTPFAMFRPKYVARFVKALERRGICSHSSELRRPEESSRAAQTA